MKYVIGTFAVGAAIALICYSATELFLTAFSTGQEPWQQYLKGVGVVTIVIWEAIAVLLISSCLRSWRLVTAAAATLCLIFAMAITFKQGLRLHVGTQADMVTSRTVKAQDRSQLSADLAEAKQRRTALYAESSRLANLAAQEAKQGGCGAKCMALNDQSSAVFAQISAINQEITDLQKRWDTRLENVRASGLPEAALAMRVAGQSEQFWTDTLSLLDPVFWTLARVFALPLAIFGVAAFFREQDAVTPPQKPQEAPKTSPVSVAIHAPRRPAGLPDVIEKAQAKPQLEAPLPPEPETPPDGDGTPVETTPEVSVPEPNTVVNFPKPLSKREKAKQKKQRVEQENRSLVEAFVVDRLDTDHPKAEIELTGRGGHKQGGTSGDDIYQEFRRYCKSRGVPGVGKSHLGRFIGEFVDRARNHKGVVYGAIIKAEARRKVA